MLLQTRVKTLDGELGAIFKRWYPDIDIEVEEMPAAAYHVGEGLWTIVRPPGTFGYVSYFATWLLAGLFVAAALGGIAFAIIAFMLYRWILRMVSARST